jgi:lipopolysaccharide transport system permease protein
MNAAERSEFWRFRELLFFLVWRDVKIRYKQTMLGAAWAIIQPFVTMIVFSIFFGRLANMPTDGIPGPIFWYSALLPWTYFSGAITNAGNSLVGNRDLITKVYFPRMILPASTVVSGLVDLFVASLLLIGMMVYYDVGFSWGMLVWPLAISSLVLLALGAGMFLSAINVNFRDVKYALPFAVQLLMFVTPVIYPTSIIPEKYRGLMALNPLSGIIEACRASLLPTRDVNWMTLGVSFAITVIIFVVGLIYFNRTQRSFADVV